MFAILLVIAGLVISAAAPGQAGHLKTEIIESARGNGSVVSLTFDDGPHPVHTTHLLSVLRNHRVKAVFCLWGDHVLAYPEVVRMIVADGHTLCNHGMHHDDRATGRRGRSGQTC